MLQMERADDGLRIRAAVSAPYPGSRKVLMDSPAKLKAFVRAARKNKPFRGKRVVTAIPVGEAKLINLNYRANGAVAESTAIVKAVQERLGSDLKGAVVDYLPIRQNDGGTEDQSALVVVARRETVTTHLERLRKCGLEVEALEVGPVAIRRLVSSMGERDEYGNAVAITFGRKKSYISVIWGRRLVLNREADFGENQLVRRLSENLELPPEEARALPYEWGVFHSYDHHWDDGLARTDEETTRSIMEIVKPAFVKLVEEINKTLIYTSSLTRGGSVQKVYLFGGVARWPGADRLLNSVLAIPVEIPNPFATFSAKSDAAVLADIHPIASIALAAGFALRGMCEDV
jgi:type IV pilus assembly protein PilM